MNIMTRPAAGGAAATLNGPGFETSVGALRNALAFVLPAVPRRPAMPVLQTVQIRATRRAGRVRLAGTDLDLAAACTIDARVGAGFTALLPARPLEAALKALDRMAPVAITVHHEDGFDWPRRAELVCGPVRYELTHLIDPGDFPRRDDAGFTGAVEIGEDFETALRFAADAASTEETRYYLNGVCLDQREDEVQLVATQGQSLKLARLPGVTGYPKGRPIIPNAAVKRLLSLLAGDGAATLDVMLGAVREYAELMRVRSKDERREIVFKLIDGTYPDFDRVIPGAEAGKFGFSCERVALRLALKQAGALMAVSGARVVGTRFDIAPDAVALRAVDCESGRAHTRIEGAEAIGEGAVGFNARLFEAVLDHAPPGPVRVVTGGAAEPCRVTWPQDETRLAVIMPLRV